MQSQTGFLHQLRLSAGGPCSPCKHTRQTVDLLSPFRATEIPVPRLTPQPAMYWPVESLATISTISLGSIIRQYHSIQGYCFSRIHDRTKMYSSDTKS
uniref:Uncharacterized protein n=1 Tax=Anguilla anguilla TaxID=7936 RepID=A0A0E9Q9P0_ANGAN